MAFKAILTKTEIEKVLRRLFPSFDEIAWEGNDIVATINHSAMNKIDVAGKIVFEMKKKQLSNFVICPVENGAGTKNFVIMQ